MRALLVTFVSATILLSSIPSTCEAQWVQINDSTKGDFSGVGIIGTTLFAAPGAGGGFFYRATGGGRGWAEINLAWTTNCLTVCDTNLIVGTSGGIYLSTDSGTNWTQVFDLPPFNEHILWVSCLAVSGTNILAGYTNGAALSTNSGASWTRLNFGVVGIVMMTGVAFKGTNLMIAPADYGADGGYDRIYVSSDRGASWNEIGSSFLSKQLVTCLASRGTNMFAGTQLGGVFRSTDDGATWIAANSGLLCSYVTCFATNGANLFAGTLGGGIFLSTDDATTWSPINSGLTNQSVSSLAVDGTNLLAGTMRGGVYLSTNSGENWALWGTIPTKPPITLPPIGFRLEQNYPNPFNPTTTIRYALPVRSHVMLTVFDALGQQVANLVDAMEEPGEHNVGFDGNGLATGVYFYRLRAGEYLTTKRLLIIR